MATVEEIEAAIRKLSREQLLQLRAWINRLGEDGWDRQIREDVEAGHLEHLAEEAIEEFRAGRTKPFPPDEKPDNT